MYTCYFCGDHEPLGDVENWSSGGTSFQIPKSKVAWACVKTSVGELWICQKCYRKSSFRTLNAGDRAEVHYEMALEYEDIGEYVKSISALKKALKLKRTANILAMLGLNYGEIGDGRRARRFYEEALKLEPQHFMSRENLKNLGHKPTNRRREEKSRKRY